MVTRILLQGLWLVFCGCCLRVIFALDYSSRTSCTRANPRVTIKYNDTLHRGVATSPDYPGNYPPNLNCTYRLEVSNGYRMVVTFENFTMQPKDSGRPDCEKDFIAVRDGEMEANSRFVGRFCGSEKPKPFLSSGRFVWIYFVSDNSFVYKGFKVTFKPKHDAVIAVCSKENNEIALFGAEGNISSPSYPGQYPPDRTCQWTLTAPQGHFVNLTFLKFESRCPEDKVIIRDVNSGGQRLGEHCGKTLPPFYRGRKLSVEFVSDKTLAKDEDGFYGIYEMIPFNRSIEERCLGGNHRPLGAEEGGVIRSPWYPHLYPNDINCQWHILAPVGERVKISFDAFDLEDASECTTDYVELTDPISTSKPPRFCGTTIPKDFESAGEGVIVRFKTDNNKRMRGFVVRYGLSHGERSTLPCVRAILLALIVVVGTLHRIQ